VLDIPTDGSPDSLRILLNRITDQDLHVENVTVETPDLDDVFFALTGSEPQAAAVAS
jgi:ABC-2 type transport system ATP-binding protein